MRSSGGGQDFISKSRLSSELLVRSISYALERRRAELRLEHLALVDSLTGTYNRLFFDGMLKKSVSRNTREPSDLAVLWIDLDRFKYVNDRWGHRAGDDLLIQVTVRLQQRLRGGDVLCRLGGDEFGVLLEGIRSASGALRVAASLQECLAERFLGLAANMNLMVVAEGVETEAQLEFLRGLHCTRAQGYLLGRPMSGPDILFALPPRPAASY